jgi:uncharacterized protein YodC (DUF2158 family)
MAKTDFKPGDKVHHKVGSPQMVVAAISNTGVIKCTWFDNWHNKQEETFIAAELELSDPHAINASTLMVMEQLD